MSLHGRRILVTGSSGYLASNLLRFLKQEGAHVTKISHAWTAHTTAGIVGDFGDEKFWSQLVGSADFFFHLGGQTSVYLENEDPTADWQANVRPMLALLEACRHSGKQPFIVFAGTVTQCGLPENTPVDETFPDRPVTVYDWHKLAAEQYLEHYARSGCARGTTLRLANVYGPGAASSKADRGILNMMMRRALKGEPLTLYGTGELLRDYVYIDDVAAAFIAAATHEDAVNGQHFIVCRGEGHTLSETFALVADRAALITGRRVPIERVPPPEGLSRIEDRNFVGDTSRLRRATGWAPYVSLELGIDLTLKELMK